MMMNATLEQLRSLKLAGMATGLQEQLTQPGMTGMSFEERLALLVDREVHWRSDKRQARLLKAAHLKYPQACIEGKRSANYTLALRVEFWEAGVHVNKVDTCDGERVRSIEWLGAGAHPRWASPL